MLIKDFLPTQTAMRDGVLVQEFDVSGIDVHDERIEFGMELNSKKHTYYNTPEDAIVALRRENILKSKGDVRIGLVEIEGSTKIIISIKNDATLVIPCGADIDLNNIYIKLNDGTYHVFPYDVLLMDEKNGEETSRRPEPSGR